MLPPTAVVNPYTVDCVATEPQRVDVDIATPLDMLGPLRSLAEHPSDRRAACIATGMHDARSPMATFAAKLKLACRIAVKTDTLSLQPADRRRSLLAKPAHHGGIIVLGTGDERIQRMGVGAIGSIDGRGDTTLRQRAGRIAAMLCPAEQPYWPRRECERGGQTSHPATHHDDRRCSARHTTSRRPIMSIRFSAARARMATLAGT